MIQILRGKNFIVTGGASGIGAGISRAIIEQGGNVLICSRRAKSSKSFSSLAGKSCQLMDVDLSDPKSSEMIFEAAISAFGRVDGLVNNAAIFPRSDIDTDLLDQFDKVFHINVRAPLMLSQLVARHNIEQSNPASIVNIGSINAYCGAPFLLIYSMSKGALMTMTRNLGDALSEHGIRTNQLNVGWTYTEGEIQIQKQAGAPDDWQEHVCKNAAPSGKLLQPEDVAAHTVFWLSEKSAPVSGSVLEIEQFPIIGRNRNSG